MTSYTILNIIMISTGVTASIVPLYFASKFWKDFRGLGLILAFMLIGESIAMAITTEFAISGLQDTIKDMSYIDFFMRRMFIFTPCLLSTILLGTFYCKRLNEISQKVHTHRRESDGPRDT